MAHNKPIERTADIRAQRTMPNHKEDAETLRLGLLSGCATVAEVVAWADGVIAAEPRPDISIIDVALAGRIAPIEVVAMLEAVPGEVDGVEVQRRFLGRLLRMLDADPSRGEEIARWLFRLAVSQDLPEEEFGFEPYALGDAFDLARQQVYGTHAEAVARLREFLVESSGSREP